MRSREDHDGWERAHLAPWATRAAATRGRAYPEPEHPNRSAFERDRDRVIHSSAFRKLEYKTQVFVNHEGDYYRTRLTHTLEVAQISRSVARLLGLNEDLAEAIALVHDVGHPPFGHAGEEALQERMAGRGGFEHNLQGLRVVTELEQRYPGFPGLNLTWEVREAIAKHSKRFDPLAPLPEFAQFAGSRWPSLEAQVADACDEIAYNAHDVDDGLTSNLIALGDLEAVPLWVRVVGGDLPAGLSPEQHKYLGVRALINAQVLDLAAAAEQRIRALGVETADEARAAPIGIVSPSPEMTQLNGGLREFLFARVYRNHRVTRMWHKAKRLVEAVFIAYETAPEQLPPVPAARVAAVGLPRAIGDFLAHLTDREAIEEHRRLFEITHPT
jgi:dGTPase